MADEFEGGQGESAPAASLADAMTASGFAQDNFQQEAQPESQPATPAPAAAPAPAAPVAPVEGQAEADEPTDLYSYLQSFEEEATPDPVAALEQVLSQNPDAAETFKAYAAAQAEVGQRFEAIEAKAEAIGGIEKVPEAVSVVADLMSGMTRGEDGVFAIDRAIENLGKLNPVIPYQLTGVLIRQGLADPAVRQLIVDQVLQSENLTSEHLQHYRNVTIDGGYKPAIASTEKLALVGAVEKLRGEREMNFDYQAAFNRLPEKHQMDLLENSDDTAYCKFTLDAVAEKIAEEKMRAEESRVRAEQEAAKVEFEGSKESNTLMWSAIEEHAQTLLARGLPEPIVKSLLFDTVMEVWKGYFTPDSPYQKTEQQILDAYRMGDLKTVKGGQKSYFDLFDGFLSANMRKVSTASVQGLPPRIKRTGAPPAGQGGQYTPDNNPPSQFSQAKSLDDAMKAAGF